MTAVLAMKAHVRSWLAYDFDTIDLVTIMTALVTLLHSPYTNEQFTTALALAAVLLPPLRRSGPFWIGVFVYRFLSQVPDHWPVLDNHQHLFNWWLLGLGLTLMATQPREALRVLSRSILGLCFLFATIWKIRSPDFLSGDFLSWRFTTDIRLRQFAESFLGLPKGAAQSNIEIFSTFRSRPVGSTRALVTGDGVRGLARIVSWYTVLIEGTIAALYLLPRRFPITRWARWALLIFIVTVYPITPIIGFALALLVYSIGATEEGEHWTVVAIPLFIVLPIFKEFETVFSLFG